MLSTPFSLLAAGLLVAQASSGSASSNHPIITEILYAVPSGPRGDASADGSRDAIGDEFIELANLGSRPIQLKGYSLVDAEAFSPGAKAERPGSGNTGRPAASPPSNGGRPESAPSTPAGNSPGDKGQPNTGQPNTGKPDDRQRGELRFTFPDLVLKPGEIVVVFNGYKQTIPGPIGDAQAAAGPNEKFHRAFVFSMKNESPYAAFGNDGDFLLLSDPTGKPVTCIRWGKPSKNPPKDCPIEDAPASFGSVQRESPRGKLVAHRDLTGEYKGTFCSPGMFGDTSRGKP